MAHGRNRQETIAKMRRILEEFTIEGVATTLPFHRALLAEPDFVAGHFSTDYVAQTPSLLTAAPLEE